MNESHRLIPLIPGLIQTLECEEEQIQICGCMIMVMISSISGGMFAYYLDKLIDLFLEKEQSDVLSKFLLVESVLCFQKHAPSS